MSAASGHPSSGSFHLRGAPLSHERIEVVRVGSTEIEVFIHETPTGGFWAEVPSMPWCATQGDTVEQLLANIEQSVRAILGLERETGS